MHRGVNTEWRVKLAASNHLLSIAIHTLTTNSKARAIRVNVNGKQRSSCKYSMNEVIDQSYKINYVSTKEMVTLFPSQNHCIWKAKTSQTKFARRNEEKYTAVFHRRENWQTKLIFKLKRAKMSLMHLDFRVVILKSHFAQFENSCSHTRAFAIKIFKVKLSYLRVKPS